MIVFYGLFRMNWYGVIIGNFCIKFNLNLYCFYNYTVGNSLLYKIFVIMLEIFLNFMKFFSE